MLLASASVLTIRIKLPNDPFMRFTRFSAAFLFIAATAVTSQLCVIQLETNTGLLTAITLSGLISFAYLRLDTKRLQPEIVWAGLWFLGIGA